MCQNCFDKVHNNHDQYIDCPNCEELICIPCQELFNNTKCPECDKEYK